MIKAVIFDVDGVLVDSFNANLKFYQDLLVKAGYVPPTKVQFAKMNHMTMFTTIKMLTDLPDEEVQKIWEMGNRRDVPCRENLMTPPKGLLSTIQTLHKTYHLGIVTSRIQNAAFAFPQGVELKNYFSAVVSYEDTVQHKPDPGPLLLAAKRLGVNPNEAVYIGDVDNDIQAARAAGMKVIIYSKAPLGNPDGYTSSFKELPNIIKTLHG